MCLLAPVRPSAAMTQGSHFHTNSCDVTRTLPGIGTTVTSSEVDLTLHVKLSPHLRRKLPYCSRKTPVTFGTQ